MRGSDFRTSLTGICLVVDQGFESSRDAQQGLARVGRYGEACKRLRTARTDLVDKALNLKLAKRLIDCVASPSSAPATPSMGAPAVPALSNRSKSLIGKADGAAGNRKLHEFIKPCIKK